MEELNDFIAHRGPFNANGSTSCQLIAIEPTDLSWLEPKFPATDDNAKENAHFKQPVAFAHFQKCYTAILPLLESLAALGQAATAKNESYAA